LATLLAARELAVSDLKKSAAFYQVLGFEVTAERTGVSAGLANEFQMRNLQGNLLRLVKVPFARVVRCRRPMVMPGLTHLNFYVRDHGETLAQLSGAGGSVGGTDEA